VVGTAHNDLCKPTNRRLAAFQQKPPVVFASDWMNEACVKGAVRSGEAAAAVFG